MSTGVDLNELQEEAEALVVLLRDRQPGLMMWNEFLSLRLHNLDRLIGQALTDTNRSERLGEREY